jgi:hypothetical protein
MNVTEYLAADERSTNQRLKTYGMSNHFVSSYEKDLQFHIYTWMIYSWELHEMWVSIGKRVRSIKSSLTHFYSLTK